jgi:3-hydroxyisobutyrate dehydrogenase-like beta-hydroxyacid dehydrogenase
MLSAAETAVIDAAVGPLPPLRAVAHARERIREARAAEALAFAEAIGLDPEMCLEVVRHGAATSFMLKDRGPRMTEAAFEPPRSALDIFVKDMGLVVGAARDASSVIRVQQGRAAAEPPSSAA